jgi:hypothetical protein
MERRRFVQLWLLLVVASAAWAAPAAAQELTLGSVTLKLGEPEAPVVEQLRKRYRLQRIDGGWSIQPLERDPKAPGIGVSTAGGRIQSVSFVWGPGFTPTAEDVGEQLAHALPSGARCEVQNVRRRQEGGIVRTLEWRCGTFKVGFQTGVWPQGSNTVTISIEKK